MITGEQYFYGWLIYIVAIIGLLGVWWYMTRKIPWRIVRNVIRLIPAVLLLMPFPIVGNDDFLAPAFFSSMLELMFVGGGEFSRAGRPVLIILGMILILYLILDIVWQKFWVKRRRQSLTDESHYDANAYDFEDDEEVRNHVQS